MHLFTMTLTGAALVITAILIIRADLRHGCTLVPRGWAWIVIVMLIGGTALAGVAAVLTIYQFIA